MLIYIALQYLYLATLLGVSAIVLPHGHQDARWGIAVILVGSVASYVAQLQIPPDWTSGRWALMLVDTIVLLGLGMIAMRSKRFWPLWIAAFQLIAVTTHLVMLIEPDQVLQAYAILQGLWAYPMLIVLLVTTLRRKRTLPQS